MRIVHLALVAFSSMLCGCFADSTEGTGEPDREYEALADKKGGDADGDGFTVKEGDCNDDDARAFPGQKKSFAEPHKLASGELSFDFDCDGKATPESETIAICIGAASPDGESCTCTPGWSEAAPECGKTADYSPATACGFTPTEKRTQACR